MHTFIIKAEKQLRNLACKYVESNNDDDNNNNKLFNSDEHYKIIS